MNKKHLCLKTLFKILFPNAFFKFTNIRIWAHFLTQLIMRKLFSYREPKILLCFLLLVHVDQQLRLMELLFSWIFWYSHIASSLILWFQISVAEFTRDRKMMSVLCSRNQLQIMFSKGAPESIISRCTNILCNDNGSTVPLTDTIRAELELRLNRLDIGSSGIKEANYSDILQSRK